MSLSSNKQSTVRGTLRQPENITQPNPSTKIPMNTSPCRPAPNPPVVVFAEENPLNWETSVKVSKPSNPAALSTHNELAPRRSRSRTKHLSLPENAAHKLTRSRSSSPTAQAGLRRGRSPGYFRHTDDVPEAASLQQSSGMNASSYRPPRYPLARRFSYEDYKHTQFVEWLEREA
jgi:hypothetical protein